MQRIKIRYADEKGNTSEEVFETRSLEELRAAFSTRGYYILSETSLDESLADQIKSALSFKKQVSLKDLNEFTKLIRTLLKSGMPITDAIDVLLDDAEDTPLNRALREVHQDIREGISLSRALGRHPEVFPEIYIKTIVAGEKAGALENILKRLSDYFTSSLAIRRKVIAAMIYPTILLAVSSLAVVYMIIEVVPEFASLFRSLDIPLPLMTSLLLSASEFLGEWFLLLFCLALLAVAAIVSFYQSPEGRRKIDRFKLRVPLLRDLEKNFAYSQFARTMSTMVEGGIPILDSLKVVLDSLENKVIARRFAVLPELLEKGLGFGKALKSIPETPTIMVRVVTVGEESGNLGEMLDNLAEHYDEEITELTDTVTSLIEPMLFLGMALVVGTLVVALLYPVLTAASQIN
ncbi:MAG TPA: type II secretion system F family protein [Candidatus Ozemobacteraceae bacterium]|nr:type II secretion system F family protein [Candidatus Ozemobacteraceae bacterium]